MPTIKLVVTGEMEKGALHTSLQGVFSGMRENQAVHWLTPHRANGATSACLPQTNKPVPKMIDLAQWFAIPNPLPGQAHPEFWVPSAGQHGSMVLRNM